MKISALGDLFKDEIELLPSEEDIIHFNKNGWHKSEYIIPHELIDEAILGAEEFYNGVVDFKLDNLSAVANDLDKKVVRNNEFVTLQKKEFQNILNHPLLLATAAKLIGTTELRLFSDSLLCKYPSKPKQTGAVGWHTDKAYWPTCSSDNMITIWIPFQDCTIDMGPVVYIDQSHQWREQLELKKFYSFGNQNLEEFQGFLDKCKPNHRKSYMTLKKGQVSIHNCHTIHCSYPNVSDVPRMALAIHLQNEDNCYIDSFDDSGAKIEIGYDKLCRKDADNNPDYSDPFMFPVVYRENK